VNIVDLARSAHSKLTDVLIPQRVVFHHVPKCGGTSVARALRRRYFLSQATVTPEASFRAFEAFTGRADREQMLIDVLDLREQMMLNLLFEDIRCVSLHVRFSEVAHANFSSSYKFVSILREPVGRFISHYYWSYGKPQAHARIEEDFEEFLETERAQRLGATYVEYYSGLQKDSDMRASNAANMAIANLRRFDVVGRLDDLQDFEAQVYNQLGVKIVIGHENKNRAPGNGSALISPELREKVVDICAPDIAVWEGFFSG